MLCLNLGPLLQLLQPSSMMLLYRCFNGNLVYWLVHSDNHEKSAQLKSTLDDKVSFPHRNWLSQIEFSPIIVNDSKGDTNKFSTSICKCDCIRSRSNETVNSFKIWYTVIREGFWKDLQAIFSKFNRDFFFKTIFLKSWIFVKDILLFRDIF